MVKTVLVCSVVLLLSSSAVLGLINVPSDGSDGVFNPTASVEVDLSQAVTGTWNQPGNGKGVYDPDKWAVVFKYSSVDIPAGVTVTFRNRPTYAPVVWLVQGDVTIQGTVNLNGQGYFAGSSSPALTTEPGPGGYRGGCKKVPSGPTGGGGSGPGGAGFLAGGSYGTQSGSGGGPTYGNAGVVPLIGGSGGGGRSEGDPTGGAGGGALLIAAAGTVTIAQGGSIAANGGAGLLYPWGAVAGGSGGAIRIIADTVTGSGALSAIGGGGTTSGGVGRIRVEANDNPFLFTCNPTPSLADPGQDPRIWPDAAAPRIKAVSLGGQPVPADPRTRLNASDVEVVLPHAGEQELVIEAENVPLDWTVVARLVPMNGAPANVQATFDSGTVAKSTWKATLNLSSYMFNFIQVRASKP